MLQAKKGLSSALIAIVIATAMIITMCGMTAQPVFADGDESGMKEAVYNGQFTYLYDDTHAVVTKGLNEPAVTDITVPKYINGVKVTGIDDRAFQDMQYLRNLTIEAEIESLEGSTISESCSLETVTLPDSIKEMRDSIRLNRKLRKINIPKGLKRIDREFWMLPALKEIELPEGIEEISGGSFYGCESLEHVTIPAGCIVSGESFSKCHSLLSVQLSKGEKNPDFEGVEVRDDGSFKECPLMKVYYQGNQPKWTLDYLRGLTATVENGVAPVDEHMMTGRTAEGINYLVSPRNDPATNKPVVMVTGIDEFDPVEVTVPKTVDGYSVTHLGGGAFSWIKTLDKVDIQAELTELPDRCFDGCMGLTSLTLPKGLSKLGNASIRDNRALQKLYVPATVTEFGEEIFDHMMRTMIIYTDETTHENKVVKFANEHHIRYAFVGKEEVIYNEEHPFSYGGVDYIEEEDGTLTAVDLVARIDTENRPEVEDVVIPEEVNGKKVNKIRPIGFSTDYYHEWGDHSLKNLVIEAAITEIPDQCYSGAPIRSVVLPPTVKKIGFEAFKQTDVLEKAILNEGLEAIGRHAFHEQTALRSIAIPSTVRKIGNEAFSACPRLTSVYMPRTVQIPLNDDEELGKAVFAKDQFLIISAEAGSPGLAYAKNEGIKYAELTVQSQTSQSEPDDTVTAELPDAVVDSFSKGQEMEVQCDDYDIRFDENATTVIKGEHGEADVVLGYSEMTSAEAKDDPAVSNDKVREIYTDGGRIVDLSLGKEAASGAVTPIAFSDGNNSGEAQVTLSYQAPENCEGISVQYIADDGTAVDVQGVSYDEEGGAVTFGVTHFSRYAIIPKVKGSTVSHKLTKTEAVVATCEKAGNKEYWTCKDCGKFFSDADHKNEIGKDSWVIPATGHTLTRTDAVAATTDSEGNIEYWTCSVCGRLFRDAAGTSEISKADTVTAKLSPKAGDTVTRPSGKYKVTGASTVSFEGAANNSSETIPNTVVIGGKTYAVTEVKANAFKGRKTTSVTLGKNIKTLRPKAFKGSRVKTITIKSKKLTKKSVKNALKGSKVKIIKVKVGSKKQNKTYIKKYKKIFTKSNAGAKVTVK